MPNEELSDQLSEGWYRFERDKPTGILLFAEAVTEVPLRFVALRDALLNLPEKLGERPYHIFYGPATRLPADLIAACRRHLGIPDDVEPFKLRFAGNEVTTLGVDEKKVKSLAEQWDGYLLEIIGTAAGTPDPSGLVAAWHPGIEGAPLIHVQVWLAIATYKTSPLRLDVRWHPERGEQISIRGLEKRHTVSDLAVARRAMSYVRMVTAAGAPEKFAPDDVKRIREASKRYAKKMSAAGASNIAQRDFALYVDCDVKTLRSFMGQHGIPWPKISPE